MLTVLPVIWVAELKILNERIAGGAQQCELTAQNSSIETIGGGLVCTEVCRDLLIKAKIQKTIGNLIL